MFLWPGTAAQLADWRTTTLSRTETDEPCIITCHPWIDQLGNYERWADVRFGANYTPLKDWFHSWLDLDLDQTRQDLSSLAGLGLDHVRIFPLWPLLQPNRTLIRRRALDDVAAVVDIAGECGLDVVVDVLQGHLSSYDFLPSWVTSWHRRNLFTDPTVVSGELRLVSALGEALQGRDNVLGLSIGNEFIQFAADRHPDRHAITPEEAGRWLSTLLDAARETLPGALHTHSYDDDLFFDVQHPFTPEHATELGDMTTVHSWVFSHLGPHLGRDHPGLAFFARYLCELALAWASDPTRQVWLQEVGAPSTHVSPERSGEFVTTTLRQVTSMDELWGVTWWCSHDVARSLADFPELEYSLGLFDEYGKLKPTGAALAEFIASYSAPAPPTGAREALSFPDTDLPSAREATSPTGPLFAAWLAAASDRRAPALVRASRASDEEYLAVRGLRRPVPLDEITSR